MFVATKFALGNSFFSLAVAANARAHTAWLVILILIHFDVLGAAVALLAAPLMLLLSLVALPPAAHGGNGGRGCPATGRPSADCEWSAVHWCPEACPEASITETLNSVAK